MNQFADRASESYWRRAVEVAARVLVVEGDPPVTPGELAGCCFPPRLPGKCLTRAQWFELRRALCRRLIFLGWSGAELGQTCRFDHDTVRALAREAAPGPHNYDPLPSETKC
jgi:hypothetical protein